MVCQILMMFVLLRRTIALPCSLTDQEVAYNKILKFPLTTSNKVLLTTWDATDESKCVLHMLTNYFRVVKQQFGITHDQFLACCFFATVVSRMRAVEQNSIPLYHREKQLFPVLLDSNPIITSARSCIHQFHPLYYTCLASAGSLELL